MLLSAATEKQNVVARPAMEKMGATLRPLLSVVADCLAGVCRGEEAFLVVVCPTVRANSHVEVFAKSVKGWRVGKCREVQNVSCLKTAKYSYALVYPAAQDHLRGVLGCKQYAVQYPNSVKQPTGKAVKNPTRQRNKASFPETEIPFP